MTFIAIGGGVVCDVTAFTASIYMRGVDVILLPTTLLSMVDASVGGKTGIDFEGYKNILGTFYPAREVRIIPEMIQSLPEREYRSGLAEVIKHALLSDEDLFSLLLENADLIKKREPELLEEIIFRSLKIKSWFIQKDPLDKDIRGYLNLGHTFGHALESLGKLSQWTHGEAVAWGLNKAMEAGVLMGLTDSDYAKKVRRLLEQYDYTLALKSRDTEDLLQNMQRDKKKLSGKLRFILQERHGRTLYSEVPEEILRKVI